MTSIPWDSRFSERGTHETKNWRIFGGNCNFPSPVLTKSVEPAPMPVHTIPLKKCPPHELKKAPAGRPIGSPAATRPETSDEETSPHPRLRRRDETSILAGHVHCRTCWPSWVTKRHEISLESGSILFLEARYRPSAWPPDGGQQPGPLRDQPAPKLPRQISIPLQDIVLIDTFASSKQIATTGYSHHGLLIAPERPLEIHRVSQAHGQAPNTRACEAHR